MRNLKEDIKNAYPLSNKLLAIWKNNDKIRADLNPNKYELEVTVWLLKNAAWQGPRQDIWSFSKLKRAKECKSIIKTMIKQQRRRKSIVIIGENERHYWKTLLNTNDFEMFWKVGRITKHTEEIVG